MPNAGENLRPKRLAGQLWTSLQRCGQAVANLSFPTDDRRVNRSGATGVKDKPPPDVFNVRLVARAEPAVHRDVDCVRLDIVTLRHELVAEPVSELKRCSRAQRTPRVRAAAPLARVPATG